jgi:hypothetical protein
MIFSIHRPAWNRVPYSNNKHPLQRESIDIAPVCQRYVPMGGSVSGLGPPDFQRCSLTVSLFPDSSLA